MIHTITRIRCENTPFQLASNQLLNSTSQHKLGQHNFEFRSVSRFHGSGSKAGRFTICLSFSSCIYIQFAFQTSRVLGVDLRQATFLTSYFHCLVPRLWGRSNFLFYSTRWSNSIPSWISSWALRLDSGQSLCWYCPGHIHLFIVNSLVTNLRWHN